MVLAYEEKSKLVRKPREPRAKGSIGGTIFWLICQLCAAGVQIGELTRAMK
jgi:hypothetical protein